MPELKEYRLFISHAWRHNADYYALENLLRNAANFRFANFSVPKHDPLVEPGTPAGKAKLREMLSNQIRPVQVVLIISGMYAAHSDWIQYEIDSFVDMGKPIIGIRPIGQERIPESVAKSAKVMVGWNTDSIVQAIRDHAL